MWDEDQTARWFMPMYHAWRAFMDGRFDDAERLALSIYAMGEKIQDHNARESFRMHLALLRCEQDRAAELLESLQAYVNEYPTVPGWKTVRIYVAYAAGDRETCRSDLAMLAKDRFAAVPRDMNWIVSMAFTAVVCSWLKDDSSALTLHELLSPYAEHYAVIGYGAATFGSVQRYLGLLAATISKAPADSWFAAARDHLDRGAAKIALRALGRCWRGPKPSSEFCWVGARSKATPSGARSSVELPKRLLGLSVCRFSSSTSGLWLPRTRTPRIATWGCSRLESPASPTTSGSGRHLRTPAALQVRSALSHPSDARTSHRTKSRSDDTRGRASWGTHSKRLMVGDKRGDLIFGGF